MLRALLVLCALSTFSTFASGALAGEETVVTKHRVTGALGAAFTLAPLGGDGRWDETGVGAGARLGYGYRIAPAADLGVGATYFRIARRADVVLPTVSVRAHWAPADGRLELGLSGRAGMTILRLANALPSNDGTSRSDVVWVGPSFAVAPDIRIALASQTALLLSLELAFGDGKTASDRHPVANADLREEQRFAQLGLWVGIGARALGSRFYRPQRAPVTDSSPNRAPGDEK